jgi:hypothetical protein
LLSSALPNLFILLFTKTLTQNTVHNNLFQTRRPRRGMRGSIYECFYPFLLFFLPLAPSPSPSPPLPSPSSPLTSPSHRKSISSSSLIGYADIDGASSFRDGVAQYLSCDPSGRARWICLG